MKNIAVLVNSCDDYSEVWPYFFTLFFRNFDIKNHLFETKIFLNTETKHYYDSRVVTLNCDSNVSWSTRFKHALNEIKSEFVIVLLDDFFLMSEVDLNEISSICDYLANSEAHAFYFKHITGQNSNHLIFDRYIKMDPNIKYFMTFQACVWKREKLIEIIKDGLSPWEIEEKNDINNRNTLILYCDSRGSYTDCSTDVFPYLWAFESGYGICKSCWLWNNKKLFKQYGLRLKRKKLGYISKWSVTYSRFSKRIKARLFNK